MKAVARRREGYTHDVEIEGGHTIVVDEPESSGGSDLGPSPTRILAASLASCTAVTIEMYAARKEWELGDVEVEVEMDYSERGVPNSFEVTLRLSKDLSEEQVDRLLVIAGKCPVHRALSDENTVTFTDRVESI